MNKIFVTSIAVLMLAGCNATNQQKGALLGGVGGGLLGNTIGKGSGNTAATIGGAILGTIAGSAVGESMDRPNQVIVQQAPGSSECSGIVNPGVRASCERGVSERNAAAQRRAEQSAYQCARYGRCN